LLAPFDVVAFYSGGGDSKAKIIRKNVEKLLQSQDALSFVPSEIFNMWPISIKTFSEMITDGGPADQFPSRLGNTGRELSFLTVPTFVAIGSDDFASYPTVSEVLVQLRQNTNLVVKEIIGASHNFGSQEPELATAIFEWLDSLGGKISKN
jgi:pimeloyl-ACP methyl ester carboxylesterase